MGSPLVTDETLRHTLEVWRANDRNNCHAAKALGISEWTVRKHLKRASERGLTLDEPPAKPGFHITEITTDPKGGQFIKEKLEPGEVLELPDHLKITGISAYVDPDRRIKSQWILAREDKNRTREIAQAMIDGFKLEIPRVVAAPAPIMRRHMLLNQYTVTDLHFGMLAWAEENRKADWDLKIAEKLLLDWFSAAIATSPEAAVAILAQLGDLMHHDALRSVTPGHGHVLDADSRLQKVIRVVIKVVRQIIAMLLEKYPHVHVVMASGNHDEASSIWMRELLTAMYENEPRVTVDNSADLYYAYEWGNTGLFYHHGHKRNIKNGVDAMFAGKFRDLFGRCRKCYGHVGHFHEDEAKDTPLMKIERHRTLAAPDAHANAAFLSERDAKVITYHKVFGEVGRHTLTPEMVMEMAA